MVARSLWLCHLSQQTNPVALHRVSRAVADRILVNAIRTVINVTCIAKLNEGKRVVSAGASTSQYSGGIFSAACRKARREPRSGVATWQLPEVSNDQGHFDFQAGTEA